MIKRLHSNLYYSHDLAATAEFYEKLGFPVQRVEGAVRIKMGDFTLAFVDEATTPIQNEAGKTPKGLGVFTYVEVDDVDAHFALIKANGVVSSSQPCDWPWGKREFAVKDPDGYKIVFYKNI